VKRAVPGDIGVGVCESWTFGVELILACNIKGHNYHKIMFQDSDSEDDTESHTSRRRTLSSNSRSGFASSSSAILSSLSSGDGSSDILWVTPETGLKVPKTLLATRLPQSDYLIQTDIVLDRLKLKPLSTSAMVRYNGGPIESCGTISLKWAWNPNDLKSEKVQRSTFYVVNDLPDSKVVLSDSDPQVSPMDNAGGMSPTLRRWSSSNR